MTSSGFCSWCRSSESQKKSTPLNLMSWGDARQGQSTIVMPPSGTKQSPVSDRIEIDKRILGIIADLEQGGRPFNNRNVWDYLTDDRTSYIDERLIHLKETGYITATIGPKRFIGATV